MFNKLYTYDGPVMSFDRLICNNWHGSTYAPSLAKARSNLTYQFKKENNMVATTRVSLPGTVILKDDTIAHANLANEVSEQIHITV